MATITRYVLIDEHDNEDLHEWANCQEAIDEASRRGGCAVVERQYEYTDSELVWTPDGLDTWPPATKGRK